MTSKNPYTNIIEQGIFRDIDITLENQCYRATIILTYTGIDTMAFLNLPANKDQVQRQDFIEWAEKYIKFPCAEQLTGEELYGARCGMVHAYTPYSDIAQKKNLRLIGYRSDQTVEVYSDPKIDPKLVMISITGFVNAFKDGAIQCLEDISKDSSKQANIENRIKRLMLMIPEES